MSETFVKEKLEELRELLKKVDVVREEIREDVAEIIPKMKAEIEEIDRELLKLHTARQEKVKFLKQFAVKIPRKREAWMRRYWVEVSLGDAELAEKGKTPEVDTWTLKNTDDFEEAGALFREIVETYEES